MNKNKKFIILVVIIVVAIAIAVAVSIILLDNKGKVNQGNFRINDLVITSSVDYHENELDQSLELSDLTFTIDQKNTIELLIAKDAECTRAYIDNISIKPSNKVGKLELTQKGIEAKISLSNEIKEVEIYPIEQEDGQYYIAINIDNLAFATDAKIPENLDIVVFDGTMLEKLGIKYNELVLDVKFNLNMVDATGKTTVCKFKLKLPREELTTSGISIVKEDLTKYVFSTK